MGNSNDYYFLSHEAETTVVLVTHVCTDIRGGVNGLMSLQLKVTFLP